MPCYKSQAGPPFLSDFGGNVPGPSYKTEADCLQACKEGACCEGTTCTVKPQCQCQCTSGSCCGPDTFTNITGETGPRCRTESQAECAARGGVWRCGVPCRQLASDPAAGFGLGSGICSSLDATPTASPVFRGVGTTCTPNPCAPCFQFCKPTNTTPPDTIYFTVSSYSASSTFRNLGNISGTYALQRDLGSCDSYSLALYPTDCNGQPNYCFTLCQKKFVIGVSSAMMFMYAFDQTQQGNSGCQGFYFFRSSGFNSCTTPTAGGSSAAAMSSNQVGASFSWSISANNPLP